MTDPSGQEPRIPRKPTQPPRTPALDGMRHRTEGHRRDGEQFHPETVNVATNPLHDGHAVNEVELETAFSTTGDVDEQRRSSSRRTRHLIALCLLLVVVLVALLLALLLANRVITLPSAAAGPSPSPSPSPSSRCPAKDFDYPDTGAFDLNVLNSTQRAGLAGQVAGELGDRGFSIGTVDNEEFSTTAPGAVVSGPGGQANAYAVQQNLPGFDYVDDGRDGSSVDVVLAEDYQALADPAAVKQQPGKLRCLDGATDITGENG